MYSTSPPSPPQSMTYHYEQHEHGHHKGPGGPGRPANTTTRTHIDQPLEPAIEPSSSGKGGTVRNPDPCKPAISTVRAEAGEN
jgi:hypothetical protein